MKASLERPTSTSNLWRRSTTTATPPGSTLSRWTTPRPRPRSTDWRSCRGSSCSRTSCPTCSKVVHACAVQQLALLLRAKHGRRLFLADCLSGRRNPNLCTELSRRYERRRPPLHILPPSPASFFLRENVTNLPNATEQILLSISK